VKERSSSSVGQCRPNGEISIRPRSASPAASSRGLPLVGKRTSWPLANLTKIKPPSCHAFVARSAKVLGPLVFDEFEVVMNEILRSRQFPDIEPNRFTKFYFRLNSEHCLTFATADVYVDRRVIIAVEEKRESVFFEYFRHPSLLPDRGTRSQQCSAAWSTTLGGVRRQRPSDRACGSTEKLSPAAPRASQTDRSGHALTSQRQPWKPGPPAAW
jgi:hypothetical protein